MHNFLLFSILRHVFINFIVRKVFIMIMCHWLWCGRSNMGNLTLTAFQTLLKNNIQHFLTKKGYFTYSDGCGGVAVPIVDRLIAFTYWYIGWFQHKPLFVCNRGFVRHQHGGGSEHVWERIVKEIQMRCCIQVSISHYLQLFLISH